MFNLGGFTMYCRNCGNELGNEVKFCSRCGGAVNTAYAQTQQAMMTNGQMQSTYKMGWYYFLIYFVMFYSAAINAIIGIMYITGSVYGENNEKDIVYNMFPVLQTLDIIVGIITIGFAAFQVYTRFALAHYRKIGPKCTCLVYGACFVSMTVHVIVVSLITGINLADIETVTSIVTSGIMTFVNYIYFKNRKKLFVN